VAIRSFVRRPVEDFFFEGKRPRREGWVAVARVVRRKLDMIHYAHELEDLRSPPGNGLEPLKGDLAGLHGIRVNDQWRIVFRWTADGPEDVDIVDYHD
jgi:proteic killer suppression protein